MVSSFKLILMMKHFEELLHGTFCIIIHMVFLGQLKIYIVFCMVVLRQFKKKFILISFPSFNLFYFLITTSFLINFFNNYLIHFLIIISLPFSTHQHGYEKEN
jgi:hypothetical protein